MRGRQESNPTAHRRQLPHSRAPCHLHVRIDVNEREAWVAARKPGRVAAIARLDRATGSLLGEARLALPAGVRIAGDTAWITDYETSELVGFALDEGPGG
jgi:hypothetical protein